MVKLLTGMIGVIVVLGFGGPYAYGQRATEIYIPIGQSPGLSGKFTVIGTIEAVDAVDQTIYVRGPAHTWQAAVTDRTQIWLDRSTLHLRNVEGSFSDLQEGLLVEVKYEGHDLKGEGPAEWIKVQPER